ncbi:MAG TPA: hypothetical protein VFQ45_04490 [Longimicrobium sp.]|nr:hypothetical protein [Longimicrobium sp.]
MKRFALAAALLLAAAPVRAQDTIAAPADTVRLRFGWQPGMTMRMEAEKLRTRESANGPTTVRMASTAWTSVAPHPRGLLVRTDSMRWDELPDALGPVGEMLRSLGSSAADPATIVTADGEFVGLNDPAALRAEVERALEPMLAEFEAEVPGIRQMMQGMMSEEALATAAADEWGAMVAFWADADLELGTVYALDDTIQAPGLGVPIPMTLEFGAMERVPCTEEETQARCVRLELNSIPDQEALLQAVAQLMGALGPEIQAEMEALKGQLSVETLTTLVTDPATLRPYSLEIVKQSTAEVEGEERVVQSDIERTRFFYPR